MPSTPALHRDVVMKPSGAERAGGVALWRHIAATLEAEIAAGTWAPGARLPTEAQMAARFAVNRHTVRRALEEMARNGLVKVEQGRGSFVAEYVMDYAVGPRTRFSEWIRRHNKEPSGKILELSEVPAERAVAAGLGLRTGARVVRMKRLGLADGKPVSLGLHHFSATRFPGLLAALGEAGTVSAALARQGVSDYRREVTRVSARMPTPTEAELLRMPRIRPLLVTESVNVDQNGAPVEFGTACYPTPRVQIIFEP